MKSIMSSEEHDESAKAAGHAYEVAVMGGGNSDRSRTQRTPVLLRFTLENDKRVRKRMCVVEQRVCDRHVGDFKDVAPILKGRRTEHRSGWPRRVHLIGWVYRNGFTCDSCYEGKPS